MEKENEKQRKMIGGKEDKHMEKKNNIIIIYCWESI